MKTQEIATVSIFVRAKAIVCPKCGAAIGQSCVPAPGSKNEQQGKLLSTTHNERIQAFKNSESLK